MGAPEVLPAVLVTGGAGYIGSHVCKMLRRSGYLPVTYDNLSGGHRWAVRWGPFELGSLADSRRLDAIMRRHRPVAVVHLAGVIAVGESVTNPGLYYEANVAGTLTLLQAMRRHGVQRIVFSSSAAVYGEPRSTLVTEDDATAPSSPYGATKLMCERMLQDFCAAHEFRAMSLRYFNAAGADPDGQIGEAHRHETHLIPLVLEVAAGRRPALALFGNDYPTRDGSCVRDFIHVSDLATAHMLALRFLERAVGNHALNLGNGAGVTVLEVVQTARRITGRPIAIELRARRPGDPAILVADASRAKRLLGWHPIYDDLETQIETAWKWQESARGERAQVV